MYCFVPLSRGKQSLNILLKMRKRKESFCSTSFDPLYLSKEHISLLSEGLAQRSFYIVHGKVKYEVKTNNYF